MKIYVSHSSGFDYQNELYVPLMRAFSDERELYLPHSSEHSGKNSKEIIANSDIVFAEVSYPSTGQGIELGWADAAGVPIICFYKTSTQQSGALKYVTQRFLKYNDQHELISQLTSAVRPHNA